MFSFFQDDEYYYKNYLNELAQANDWEQLRAMYQDRFDALDLEDKQYQIKLIALNDANTDVYVQKILPAQWCAEYLKQFRLCLINESELFRAFRDSGNLKDHVTQIELINSLALDYDKQINDELVKITGRTTTIHTAINFLSMPLAISDFYDAKIMVNPSPENKFNKFKKLCLDKLADCAKRELQLFYKKFEANKSNYLYYLVTKNFPGATDLLLTATLAREDLEELRDRLKSPSTILNGVNKDEWIQQINTKIETLPVSPQPNDRQCDIVVRRKSYRSGK